MSRAHMYLRSMPREIKIRNVPESLHRALKARAAMSGMSLSDFLLGELRAVAERPTIAELRERLHCRSRVAATTSAANAVRRERDTR